MPENLEGYKYLWDGSAPGWVLLKAPDLAGGLCIFNELSSVLLHVDDEQLNLLLCQHMKEQGCRVIDTVPKQAPVRVTPLT